MYDTQHHLLQVGEYVLHVTACIIFVNPIAAKYKCEGYTAITSVYTSVLVLVLVLVFR